VLIVDDHPANAARLHGLLVDCGCKPDIALTAEESVEMATRRGYWLIIVALEVPGGFDLVAQLRVHDSRVAIVGITTSASLDTSLRALEAGASVALVEPVAPSELCERVARLLERRSTEWKPQRLRNEVDQHLGRNKR
jgi:DNA-binding response OmpR family regulator